MIEFELGDVEQLRAVFDLDFVVHLQLWLVGLDATVIESELGDVEQLRAVFDLDFVVHLQLAVVCFALRNA